jgi:glycosyltransferase involved in cell wall biosynthesis
MIIQSDIRSRPRHLQFSQMAEFISSGKSEWATCSLRDFRGCEVYSNRDAGLVAQGFRENGVRCRSVLLGSPRENDLPGIVRAGQGQLETPEWWAKTVEQGVVFYNALALSCGPVLRAAKEAGLRVALNVDSTGVLDFQSGPIDFWKRSMMHHALKARIPQVICCLGGVLKSGLRTCRGGHRELASHLALADVIGAVTPAAAARLRRFLRRHREGAAAERVCLIPHPVHPRFSLQGAKPQAGDVTFVSVGRWFDRSQKRPDLLMKVTDLLLAADPNFRFRVFGKLVPEMERWHSNLSDEARERVSLHGLAPNAELLEAYRTAHVYLCVSSYESFLIAGAEAMACGCSLVACSSPSLPGPSWFAEDDRGTLSPTLVPGALRDAALAEAHAWQDGRRDPTAIAAWAARHMHAGQVANRYMELLGGWEIRQPANA